MADSQRLVEIKQGSSGYPRSLRERLGRTAPASLRVIGDPVLLQQNLLAIFCSVRCPGNEILRLYDVARGLRDAGVPTVSGFHTPMEKECLITLLRGKQPIVICPARSIHRLRVPDLWQRAIAEGRLIVVSAFAQTVTRTSKETGAQRNRLVAALAENVLIAHAEPGGQTAQLAAELTKAGRSPWNLASSDVAKYVEYPAHRDAR